MIIFLLFGFDVSVFTFVSKSKVKFWIFFDDIMVACTQGRKKLYLKFCFQIQNWKLKNDHHSFLEQHTPLHCTHCKKEFQANQKWLFSRYQSRCQGQWTKIIQQTLPSPPQPKTIKDSLWKKLYLDLIEIESSWFVFKPLLKIGMLDHSFAGLSKDYLEM